MLKYKKVKIFFWWTLNQGEFLRIPMLAGHTHHDDLCRKSLTLALSVSMSGLDLSETLMSDEWAGNLLKISVAKQIFIRHALKSNYSINRKLLQKMFLQIHICIKSTCCNTWNLYYVTHQESQKKRCWEILKREMLLHLTLDYGI